MRYEVSKVIKQHYVMDMVFGNSDCPSKILGRHFIHNGQVIAAWHPDACAMSIRDEYGEIHELDAIERTKIFAVYLPTREQFSYEIIMDFPDGNQFITADPYNVQPIIRAKEEAWFLDGVWTNSYKKLGAHPMVIDGISGVYFAVWAPAARRVSVVGEFNFWNGMIYPMNRIGDSGIFELFIPGLSEGAYYKYEIKTRDGNLIQKADPYGFLNQNLYGDASIVVSQNDFQWNDKEWLQERKQQFGKDPYISIADYTSESNYHSLKEFNFKNFTHVLIGGSVDDKNYRSWTESGVYSIPFEEASLNDVKELIDTLHQRKIGVLLKCDFGYFHERMYGLMQFDGSSLYGFSDERKKYNKAKKRYRFGHTKDEVQGYLFSAMMMWIKEFHVDGFVFENMEEILFPEWEVAKDMIPCFEKAYRYIKKYDSSVLVLGETDQELSYRNEEKIHGKKFYDFYLDNVVVKPFQKYWEGNEQERRAKYYSLVQPFQKAEIEKSILGINACLPANSDQTLYEKWKMASAYMIGMPGMKLCQMKRNLEQEIKNSVDSLFALGKDYPVLQNAEYGLSSFEWINGMNASDEMVSYIRKSEEEENLLFISNFSPIEKEAYYVGVPQAGEYTLVMDTSELSFERPDTVLVSEERNCDLRNYAIKIRIKPYTTLVFKFGGK